MNTVKRINWKLILLLGSTTIPFWIGVWTLLGGAK